MKDEEATVAVLDALASQGIPFMVVGSISVIYWSFPCGATEPDLVIDLGDGSLALLMRALGPGFRLDPQMSFETVTMTGRNEITVRDSAFSIEFFHLSRDAHDQERFRRRVSARILNRDAFVPTAEDVIITKLRWARPKDREDLRNVIAVQGDERIDWAYVHGWTNQHGTTALLDEIRRSIPPI